MVRAAEDGLRVADLLQAAEVHDRDPVGDVADNAEVVGDEDVAHAFLRLQLDEEVQDRRLHRDVERRGRLVAEDDARVAREGTRDGDALFQPARELRRLRAQERLVEAHRLDELARPLVPVVAVQAEKLVERAADDSPHRVAPVERSIGVLKDDLKRAHLLRRPLLHAAGERFAVELERRALVGRREAEQDPRQGGLAAARLADQAEHFAGAHGERNVDKCVDVLALLFERLRPVLDLEEWIAVRRPRGSREPRRGDAWQLVRPVVEVAAARAPVAEREEIRFLLAADLLGESAARFEDAARQAGTEPGEEPRDRVQRGLVLPQAAARDAAEKADRVGVPRVTEDLLGGPLFDEPAGIEHADALAHLRDDREVVADEEDARPELLAQRRDEVEHLGLYRGVEARRRLVENEERRVLREGHSDDDALLHAARELMRVAAHHPLSGRRSGPCAAWSRSGAAPPHWKRREARMTSASCGPTRIDGFRAEAGFW